MKGEKKKQEGNINKAAEEKKGVHCRGKKTGKRDKRKIKKEHLLGFKPPIPQADPRCLLFLVLLFSCVFL